MNAKTTIALVIALAIAVAGIWWAQSSKTAAKRAPETAEPKQLLDPPLGELRGFEIKTGAEPAVVFEMRDNKWRIIAPIEWPADDAGVNNDATKIKSLTYVKTYPKGDPDRPTNEQTSLEAPLKIVKLTDKDGKSYVIKIGATQALSKRTYVQREGSDTIYLVDGDLAADLRKSLSDYRSKRIAEFNQADAVRVEVTGDRQYTLVKSDGRWTIDSPVKGRADVAKISSMLKALSGLSVQKFVDDAPKSMRPYGLDPPRLRVAVTTEIKTPKPATSQPASAPAAPEYDVTTRTIQIVLGGVAEKEVFSALASGGKPAVFTITEDSANQAVPPLDELRDKKVTNIQTNRVQQITVLSGGSSVRLTKADGNWQMTTLAAGETPVPAESAAVDDFLKALRELTATGFEATELPTFGFASPRATIELMLEGQLEPERLIVGGLTSSKTGAYVRNEREGFIAVVKVEAADAMIVRPTSFMSRQLLTFTNSMASKLVLGRGSETCEVAKEQGEWKFVLPIQGQAEVAAVNNIVTDLANLRGRQVVALAADAGKYGLDAQAVTARITVDMPPMRVKKPTTQPAAQPTTTSPAEMATPPATQPVEEFEMVPQPPRVSTIFVARHEGKVYAMIEGGATICEVDAKVLDDLETELFDTRVIGLDATQARRLEIAGETSFAFEKSGKDWLLAGEPSFQTDATKITNVLTALKDLKTKRYVKYTGANLPEFGLDKPAIKVTFEMETGQVVTLSISSKGPQGTERYASTSAAPDRVFVITADDAAKFTKQVQDFRRGS
ncbi:MAG TPA: DUF4340 domain-containing protein [Phycisphaerae bacterium]|nr:DUF4340 domain-containing protein [Phycisphaerae bacterium]